MKKLKRIFVILPLVLLAIFAVVVACSKENIEGDEGINPSARLQNNQIVAELNAQNQWVITANKDDIYAIFEEAARKRGENIDYNYAEIKISNPNSVNPPRYALYVYSSNRLTIAATTLKLAVRTATLQLSTGITCTSTDPCSQTDGCTPTEIDGPNGTCVWSCSGCAAPGCTKSVSHP